MGVVVAIKFNLTTIGVSVVIVPALGHEHSFVKLVEQNIRIFGGGKIVVEPDFFLRHPRIDDMVAAIDEIDKESASNQTAINNPDD